MLLHTNTNCQAGRHFLRYNKAAKMTEFLAFRRVRADGTRPRAGGAISPSSLLKEVLRQKIGQKGVLSNPYIPMNLASMIELK